MFINKKKNHLFKDGSLIIYKIKVEKRVNSYLHDYLEGKRKRPVGKQEKLIFYFVAMGNQSIPLLFIRPTEENFPGEIFFSHP